MLHKCAKAWVTGSLLLASQLPLSAQAAGDVAGALYTMSNDADGNSVLMFDRDPVGKLTPAGEFATGGLGTSDGLGNQGGLIIDPAGRWLFVVNAGSNDLSVFAIEEDGLELVDQDEDIVRGARPISLTYAHNLLYVLYAGGAGGSADSIYGFRVGDDGTLTPIDGSNQSLSAASTAPAQIGFNSDGDVLIVTEKATDRIDTFVVDADGVAGAAIVHQLPLNTTPFGFAVGKRDQLIVSEAFGGAADASAVSSYRIEKDGDLTLITPSAGTTETAACWAIVSNDGRITYVTNAGSGSISGYRVGFDGSLTLLDANGVTGNTGKDTGPLDMAASPDGRNLYTLNGGSDTIGAFRIKAKGGLASLNSHIEVPISANGLAIR
jgi:6-phosphogluconolactonase (cycloisomerase 2 family)